MGKGEIELGPHRVEEHAQREQRQHQLAPLRRVAAPRRPVVAHRNVREHDLAKGPIADDLGGDLTGRQHVPHAGAQIFAQPVESLIDALRPEHAERGARRHGRNRIAAEARRDPDVIVLAHPILAHEVHDLGAATENADRIAAAERLAVGHKIGDDAVIFLGAAIGEAKTGDHLVEDERDIMCAREFPQPLEEAGHGGRAAL